MEIIFPTIMQKKGSFARPYPLSLQSVDRSCNGWIICDSDCLHIGNVLCGDAMFAKSADDVADVFEVSS
jgi:hypothetical protein